MTTIAAIIIGIDGWEQYTLPLVESIQQHEPGCQITVIDNLSKEPYPQVPRVMVERHYYEPRRCYSSAINLGHDIHKLRKWDADWYLVLSNDVLCTGPFADILEQYDNSAVLGPQLWHEHGLSWIVGWCVAIPKRIWDAVGGWDERYIMSSWEDVDFSHSARRKGFGLEEIALPFVHLDQRQRFGLPGYGGSEVHNRAYFMQKHELAHAY